MKDIFISIVIPIVVPILTSLISYFAARHQANTELQKVKEQHNIEMHKIKEQYDAEIRKMKEQYALEIEKIKTEMEKQAELYEKTVQTDKLGKLFDQILEGDTSGLEAIMKAAKIAESGTFKHAGHPANKR